MKRLKKAYFLITILTALLLSVNFTGCLSRHVIDGFGNAIWQSEDPYFYWYENFDYKEWLAENDPYYTLPEDAAEEEILRLYGKMEIKGRIEYVRFLRSDLAGKLYDFEIVVHKSNSVYLEGEYSYRKIEGKSYDYEVYLTVRHAYDIDTYYSDGGTGYGDEIELPFESFTIYVTCVK